MTTLPRGTAALGHRVVRRRRAVAAVGAVSAGLLPLNGTLGLSVAAAIIAAGWLTTVRGLLDSA
ncbi:hypothetical protein ACF1G8_15215, partial [Streptomyces tendae]